MRSAQDLIHWLEQGRGARALALAALVLGGLVLTVVYSWRQFHGIPDEFVMQQAVLARQIATGKGFTTLVNYPQTSSVVLARGMRFEDSAPYPELYNAPLYPIVMASVFAVLPGSVWENIPETRDGWVPDYVILLINVALLWGAVAWTARLALRVFDSRVAWIAGTATALSVPLWQHTVTLAGVPLMMLLAVAVVDQVAAFEQRLSEIGHVDRGAMIRAAVLGLLCGLLFLSEYSAGLVALVVACYLVIRIPGGRRWVSTLVFSAAFTVVIAPWMVRNMAVVGNPLGLAWQNLALKAGDSTAEPAAQRNLLTTAPPGLDTKKLGNKGLTGLELNLKERLWSGGGMMLTAFFIAGLAYQFRYGPANRVRWFFGALLLVMLAGQPFFSSGESTRLPAYYLAPCVIVFGAGFFLVLLDSQVRLAEHWRWAAFALLLLQGLPLVRDSLEPRKIHFHFPPYFPNLFMELRRYSAQKFVPGTGIASDVPAGTAWYGRMRVWSKPERIRDFQEITVKQNIGALLLTPVTLDRPFFAELAARSTEAIRLSDSGGWGDVYTGLVTRRMPAGFPLSMPPERVMDNMVLLTNPATFRQGGN